MARSGFVRLYMISRTSCSFLSERSVSNAEKPQRRSPQAPFARPACHEYSSTLPSARPHAPPRLQRVVVLASRVLIHRQPARLLTQVRRPFEPPNELQVFTLLTGETEASMIDTLIDVTVDRILPGRSGGRSWVTVYCKLDNGMRGILPVSLSARSTSELVQHGRLPESTPRSARSAPGGVSE